VLLRLILSACCSYLCLAETHKSFATKFYNSFHHRHAVQQRIKPGDTVITRTIDASGRDEKGKLIAEPGNPLTGTFLYRRKPRRAMPLRSHFAAFA
jgi:hypothetical protein